VFANGGTETDDITLTTTSGSIEVGTINAAGLGDVTLSSAAGITDTDSNSLVTAQTLSMTAANEIGGANAIQTTAEVLVASSTGAGAIRIVETDGVTLQDVVNANGLIDIRAGGPITAVSVRANGGTDTDDITLTTTSGSIEVGTILAVGVGDLRLVSAVAINDLNALSAVSGDSLQIAAGTFAFLQNSDVSTLQAVVGGQGSLDATRSQLVDPIASTKSRDFLGDLRQIGADETTLISQPIQNPNGDAAIPGQYDFESKYSGLYGLFIRNQSDLTILGASSTPSAPALNYYLQTMGNSDLIVSGAIATNRAAGTEGGIVLVAGGELTIGPGGMVSVVEGAIDYQRINNVTLTADVFQAGTGLGATPSQVSTKFVLPIPKTNLTTINGFQHPLQQAVMNYGSAGEFGFDIFVAYADGQVRRFDRLGETSQIFEGPTLNFAPDFGNSLSPIGAALASDGVFTVVQRTADDPASASPGTINRFSDAFLSLNVNLPTNVIVRRASDFFLFEGVGTGAVEDLTYDSHAIRDVKSLGEPRGLSMPSPQEPDRTVFVEAIEPMLPPQVLIPVVPPRVEIGSVVAKESEVIIYRIDYEDQNDNNQPEDFELPPPEEVLKWLESGEATDDRIVKRYKTETGGNITGEEINRLKEELRSDSSKQTGAYSIIETPPNRSPKVIDTFGLRDDREQPILNQPDAGLPEKEETEIEGLDDKPLIPLKDGEDRPGPREPQTGDGAAVMPVRFHQKSGDQPMDETRSWVADSSGTAAAWLAASIWLRRRSSPGSADSPVEEGFGLTFAERFRRRVAISLETLRLNRTELPETK
jgi:hypothetical protein